MIIAKIIVTLPAANNQYEYMDEGLCKYSIVFNNKILSEKKLYEWQCVMIKC